MNDNTAMVILMFMIFGWIPILAIGTAISKIIYAKESNKCEHDLEYEEIQIISPFSKEVENICVYVVCRKCGYHNSYEKY